MDDLIRITDIVKDIMNIPFNIFGYDVTILSIIIGTLILSVAIIFVLKLFGGD